MIILKIASYILILHCIHSQAENTEEKEARLLTLVQEDESAIILWNFTNKYGIFHASNIDVRCLDEIEKNNNLLLPYYFNITGIQTYNFLHAFPYKNPDSLYQAHEIQKNISEMIQDLILFNLTAEEILQEMDVNDQYDYFCLLNSSSTYSGCDCFFPRNFVQDNYFNATATWESNALQVYITFGTFIDPIVFILIILIGVILNGTMLIIFIKESAMRSEYHIIIFTMILNNLITLLLYLPLRYSSKYMRRENYIENIIETLVISVYTFSILMLHIQRYFDISRILKPQVSGCRSTSKARCAFYTSFVWICSAGFTCLTSATSGDFHSIIFQLFVYILLYIFIFPLVIAIFSCLTASQFQSAAKQGRTSSEVEKILASKVNLLLTITYYVSLVPFIIFIYTDSASFHYGRPTVEVSRHILFTFMITLLTLYPTWTCVILYKCSSVFRMSFRKYLFRCWLDNDDEQYVTMSSLRHAEI